jgi:hypothetical protein
VEKIRSPKTMIPKIVSIKAFTTKEEKMESGKNAYVQIVSIKDIVSTYNTHEYSILIFIRLNKRSG